MVSLEKPVYYKTLETLKSEFPSVQFVLYTADVLYVITSVGHMFLVATEVDPHRVDMFMISQGQYNYLENYANFQRRIPYFSNTYCNYKEMYFLVYGKKHTDYCLFETEKDAFRLRDKYILSGIHPYVGRII